LHGSECLFRALAGQQGVRAGIQAAGEDSERKAVFFREFAINSRCHEKRLSLFLPPVEIGESYRCMILAQLAVDAGPNALAAVTEAEVEGGNCFHNQAFIARDDQAALGGRIGLGGVETDHHRQASEAAFQPACNRPCGGIQPDL
jgi:hypothetical protein